MQTLRNLYKKGEPIAMITAHDFPSARAADESGMDMVLVGDSLGMVAMGLENTTEVVMEEMLLHCRSVARGAKHAFIVRCSLINPARLNSKANGQAHRSAIYPWVHMKFPPSKQLGLPCGL